MQGVKRRVGFRIEVKSDVVELLIVVLTFTFLLLTHLALHSLPVASSG